jgi:hypothetical protein
VHYRTLDVGANFGSFGAKQIVVPECFDCHVALFFTDYFSATDGTVNIGVQDRRFLAMRMVYLLKAERDAACEAKASTLSVITPASPR